MRYRLLHISDVHLERSFASMGCQGELARRRRDGLRLALRRTADLVREYDCDALTIGGDLYEHDRATADTGSFLARLFDGLQPMPVLIASGNHDPAMRGSLYGSVDWPSNVHLFTEPVMSAFELTDGLTLWGLGHDQQSWQGDPLDIDPIKASGIHIALFHGSDLGYVPEGKVPHGPFHARSIRPRGFAAALCGHYHVRRCDERLGLLYPGTPEPLAFDEEGRRGPAIVELDERGNVTFSPLDVNVWHALTAECDLSEATTSSHAVETAIEAAVSHCNALDPEHTLLRLRLVGAVPCSTSIDLYTIEAHVRETCGLASVRVIDDTNVDIDAHEIATEPSVRGEFSRSMLEKLDAASDDNQSELVTTALRYGLEALSGSEVGLR